MKNCAYCGRENADETTHCRECGTSEFVVSAPLTSPAQDSVEMVSEVPEPEPEVPPDGESALCTYCVFPNLPEVPWCKRCGASINYSSIVGPTDAAWASGFMWRGALRGHPKPFVIISVWILFLPKLLWDVGLIWLVLASGVRSLSAFATLWVGIFFSAIAIAMLYRVTKNYLTIPKVDLSETAN
jgi:hypothetical protein